MSLTSEQDNIIHSSAKDLLVQAFAGTGKSFTAIEYIKAHPKDKLLYLVFNASASKEMQEKLFKQNVRNVTVKTLHSLAYAQMKDIYRSRLENNGYSVMNMAENYGKFFPSQKDSRAKIRAMRLLNEVFISFLKSAHTSPSEVLKNLPLGCIVKMKNYNISIEELQDGVKKLWSNALSPTCTEPVSHDVYLKAYQLILQEKYRRGDKNALGYSCVILDEAQDTFPSALEIVRSQEEARHLILGDPYQQIYGWNKSIDAFGVLGKEKNVNGDRLYKTLPLTQSFRCPQSITEKSMPWLALLGNKLDYRGLDTPLPDDGTIAYLTRTNSVLLLTMANMQEEGTLNQDFSNVCLFGGASKYDFTELSDCALLSCNEKSQIKNDLVRSFDNFAQLKDFAAETEDEKTANTCALVERHGGKRVLALIGLVRRGNFLQNPEPGCFIFSTAHKMKGSEAASVVLTEDFLSPLKILEKAEKMEDMRSINKENDDESRVSHINSEEFRTLYVACTRPKNHLSAESYDMEPYIFNAIKKKIEEGAIQIMDELPSGRKVNNNAAALEAMDSPANQRFLELQADHREQADHKNLLKCKR